MNEMHKKALSIVLGNEEVPTAVTEENKDLFKILLTCGIAMATSNKKGEASVIKFDSKNMMDFTGNKSVFCLDSADIELWKGLSFQMDFTLGLDVKKGRGLECKITKATGDTYAVIGDHEGRHTFGAYVLAQDSRSPWLLLEGDERPFGLMFTYKNSPTNEGKCVPFTGWVKTNNGWVYDANSNINGGKSTSKSTYTIQDCNKALKKIMKEYFGRQFDQLIRTAYATDRFNFVEHDSYNPLSVNDCHVELVKNKGSDCADILVDSHNYGKLSISCICTGSCKFEIELFGNENVTIDRYALQSAIWSMVLPQKETKQAITFGPSVGKQIDTAFSKKHGKKQYAV